MSPGANPAPQLEPAKTPRAGGWLSPAEAAEYLTQTMGRQYGVRTVQSWCRRSKNPLPHLMPGGRLLIHRDDLLAWLERGGATVTRESPHPSSVTNGGGNDGE